MEGNFRDHLNSWIFIFFFFFFAFALGMSHKSLLIAGKEINEKNISLIGCYYTDHCNEKSSKMNFFFKWLFITFLLFNFANKSMQSSSSKTCKYKRSWSEKTWKFSVQFIHSKSPVTDECVCVLCVLKEP